jgi:hypothetical protein
MLEYNLFESRKKIYWILAILILSIIIYFSFILILPLFTNNVVNEDYPITMLYPEYGYNTIVNENNDDVNILDNFSTNNSNYSLIEDIDEITTEMNYKLIGSFVDGDKYHKTSGNAIIISDTSSSTKYLRLEDFKTTNGPDLYVYLATDTKATDFVNLGVLKGNVGNQNYEIPKNTDLTKYSEVLIWCEDFSVLFGSANLE